VVDFRKNNNCQLKKADSFNTVQMERASVASELDYNFENASQSEMTSIDLNDFEKNEDVGLNTQKSVKHVGLIDQLSSLAPKTAKMIHNLDMNDTSF